MYKKILSILVLILTLSFSTQAFASLTFTTDAITGTTASGIDLGTGNTLSLQTTSNAPITTGTGLVTLGGNLAVTGLTAARIPFTSTGGLLVDDSSLTYGAGVLLTDHLNLIGTVEANGANPPLNIETSFPTGNGTIAAAKILADSSYDDGSSKAVLRLTGNYSGSATGSTGNSYGLYSAVSGDSKTPISNFSSSDKASIGVYSTATDYGGGYGGDMIGIFGKGGTGVNRNIGMLAYGRSGVLAIGGAFYASNGTNNIGLIGTLSSTIPTATSAAILANNGTVAAPIFLAQDNGTTKFTIKDGGTVNVTVATYADNTAALAGGLVAGDVYRTSTGVLMVVY